MRVTGIVLVAGAAALAGAQAASASDRSVKAAVSSYQAPIAAKLTAITKCGAGAGAKARACRAAAGKGLVVTVTTAGAASRGAARTGASSCVRQGLDTYQIGLNQYAAAGRALQRGQTAGATTLINQARTTLSRGRNAVLRCAAPTPPPPPVTG